MNRWGIAFIGGMLLHSLCLADPFEDWAKTQALEVIAAKDDLSFNSEPKEFGVFTNYRNSILRPADKGTGPFPALVLLHGCSGIGDRAMRQWIEGALTEGFVVSVVDSMRGNKSNCYPPLPVSTGRRVKDAYDALAVLSGLPFVDAKRISVAGLSQGGTVTILSGSKNMASLYKPVARFAAGVAIYPNCFVPAKIAGFDAEYVRQDTEAPLLSLMGGDDLYTPANECLPMLEKLKLSGNQVEWHVYPNATHAWDSEDAHGRSSTTYRGDKVTFRYDRGVTEDSRKRLFEFLKKHAGSSGK